MSRSIAVEDGLHDAQRGKRKMCVSFRQVNYYCVESLAPGSVKMTGVWLLPQITAKPADKRRKQNKDGEKL